MPNCSKGIVVAAALCLCAACLTRPHRGAAQTGETTLREHLEGAQRFQQSGKLNEAAGQYRAFLAEAMGELAIGHVRAGDYSKAPSYFDEALELEPNSPELRLEYARAALLQGELSRAETLARAFLREYPRDSQGSATAHQILGRALLKKNQDQQARRELEAAVALDPSFENGYDLAVVCLDLDDEKCAAQLFGEMEASFGNTADLHMNFGRAYGNSDFAPKAVVEFKKVLAINSKYPGAHYSLAAALLVSGEDEATVAAAEKELEEELTISPDDFLTYAALGKIAAGHHKYAEAETYLKRAVSLNPKNPDAFVYLGQLYFDTDRSADAEVALRHAIELTIDESRNHYQIQKAHFLLGRLLMQEHRGDEAHAEMEKARAIANQGLSQDKRNLAGTLSNRAGSIAVVEAASDLGATLKTETPKTDPDALKNLNEFEKELTSAIADGYNNLGVIAATGSNYLSALQYFARAEAWDSALEGLDLNLGRAAFMASRFADAIAPLSRYLGSHPDDSGIRGALAISRFMTGDYSGCVDTIGKDEAEAAAIPQVQYAYADSLVKTGQLSSGTERLEVLATRHPEIEEVHRALGEAFELHGEKDNAAKELRIAIQLNAKDAEAHYVLGNAELEAGDAANAVRELETAVQILPRNPRFHRELARAYMSVSRSADADRELAICQKLENATILPAPAMIGAGAENKDSHN